ncbi:srf-type transcription factor [Drechmeria coniospora]|uniref:Srf-type transcription factor n=1 Tax=Drechmeria coniospora TaxID=98403 RepID=A0A151GB74_DRECN|nr:srf-type transcription factor [Drechmeria coniospora]KYK54360.1 srf-type transcription factor [Drechmeria coniospora]
MQTLIARHQAVRPPNRPPLPSSTLANPQQHGGTNEHKGPSDFNGGNDEEDDDEADVTPPRAVDAPAEAQMMPPQFHGQQQPFSQILRHHTPSASPPVGNGGPFQGHPGHPGHPGHHGHRASLPQQSLIPRPDSRNDSRRMPPNVAPQPIAQAAHVGAGPASAAPSAPFRRPHLAASAPSRTRPPTARCPTAASHGAQDRRAGAAAPASRHGHGRQEAAATQVAQHLHADRGEPVDIVPAPRLVRLKRSSTQGSLDKPRNASMSSGPDGGFTPPSRPGSVKVGGSLAGSRSRGPRLTVQIPDEASEPGSGTGESNSPHNTTSTPTLAPQRHNSHSSVVLPPPSPSATALLSAGASGPPNPFARPPPHQTVNGDTPVSALPSRFLNNELLPSPSSFYPDWNFRGSDSNTLPSPLNFATPVVGSGPSFLRDDHGGASANPTSAGGVTGGGSNQASAYPSASLKRKSPDYGPGSQTDGHAAPDEPKRVKVEL